MQLDSIPRDLTTLLYVVIATSLGWVGGWITRRKREPAEIAKLSAETRQIEVNTDVSLIQAATIAITKAERLQDERDHWERKAGSLQRDLDLANIDVASMDIQMRKQMHFIELKNMKEEYLKLDQPKPE